MKTTNDAIAARAEGMERADEHADATWKVLAEDTLHDYLTTHSTFHCDDIWKAGLPQPREARALGPVILRARRAGWMEPTDQYRPSVHSNMTAKPVWRSLLYSP